MRHHRGAGQGAYPIRPAICLQSVLLLCPNQVNLHALAKKAGADASLAALTEGSQQWLPSQRARDITYVSRMECVQAAVHAQLEALAQADPSRPAGLITFAGEVVVHSAGDEQVTLAGPPLYASLSPLLCVCV